MKITSALDFDEIDLWQFNEKCKINDQSKI